MNKIAKISIAAGLGLVCLGIILSLFNFKSLFAPFYSDTDGDYEKKTITIVEEIEYINIDTSNEDVIIKPTSENNIIITYYENKENKYNYTTHDSTFTLTKERNFHLFFNFSFDFFSRDLNVIIEIPESKLLTYDIKTSNAKIEINNLKINKTIFKTSNDKINVSNVESTSSMSLTSSNSSINVSNFKSLEELNIKTSNGKIDLTNVTTNTITNKTSNADIQFRNLIAKYIDFETTNSDIEGEIIGTINDYSIDIKTSNGEIEVNNQEHGESYQTNNGTQFLKLKTNNSDIEINFK